MKFLQYIENGIRYNRIGDCKVAVAGFGIDMDVKHVRIPTLLKNGNRVIWITPSAFEKNITIESIVLPDTISLIGENAFYKCPNLKEVVISHQDDWDLLEQDMPVEIQKRAFSGCRNLTTFSSCKSIKLRGSLVFHNCVLLPKIIGKIYGDLPEKSFLNCMSLKEFEFFDETTLFENNCFDDCPNLSKFYLYQDLDLNEEFLTRFKDATFYCIPDSKYLSLAYHGHNIKKILPRV